MLSQVRRLVWLAGLTASVMAADARAQGRTMTPARTLFVTPQKEEAPAEIVPDVFANVALMDAALPRTQLRVRTDVAQGFRRPTMAEYFQPKGGLPFSPGPPLPETNVDYQEILASVEYALDKWFSVFLESPLRWVNPERNANAWGEGDVRLGFKLGVFTEEHLLATFQLRAYVPTAGNNALGTDHWSLEPALLASWRVAPMFQLDGELRYWTALGGTDFAGSFLRYGLGLTYGQPSPNEIWLTPVIEVVGWSLLDGQALTVSPGLVGIQNVSGETIVNAQAGLRLGLGHSADFYLGYGRALTGVTWYRDMVRVEFRWNF